jgi:hypothetical protein
MNERVVLQSGFLLVAAAAGYWAALLSLGEEMPMGLGLWIGAWTLMMAAMMPGCRNPVDFLVTHWRSGRVGTLRIGAEHGAFCVGCCWALMVVLVVVGPMGLAWAVAIALAIAAERLLPAGPLLGRLGGVGLIVAGLIIAF